jgi:hypothetical protein
MFFTNSNFCAINIKILLTDAPWIWLILQTSLFKRCVNSVGRYWDLMKENLVEEITVGGLFTAYRLHK